MSKEGVLQEANESVSNILLPEDKDFLITHNKSGDNDLNITYRCPRKVGDMVVPLIATTTLKAGALNNFRVEEMDGQHFVVNDPKDNYYKPTRFSVMSEQVGHAIQKAVLEEVSKKQEESLQKKEHFDKLGLSDEHWRINKIAEEFAPLIFTASAVLLALSASFWLVFK